MANDAVLKVDIGTWLGLISVQEAEVLSAASEKHIQIPDALLLIVCKSTC